MSPQGARAESPAAQDGASPRRGEPSPPTRDGPPASPDRRPPPARLPRAPRREGGATFVSSSPLSGRLRRRARREQVVAERRRTSRFAVIHDTSGPKVRLGIAWFVAALGAMFVGPLGLGLLTGAVAVVAALQASGAWHQRREHPQRVAAAACAGLMPLAAAHSPGLVGTVVLVFVFATLGWFALDRSGRTDVVTDTAMTIRCGLFPGLAAASIVLVLRVELAAAITLLVLVSVYETGDYLVGSGSANLVEGPAAGVAGVIVLTAAAAVFEPAPFSEVGVLFMGAVVAVLAPLGPLVGSAAQAGGAHGRGRQHRR
ncbi:MAG: hypothetical protein S0880_31940, partial [Actinomycetota bacterium]|nr:hypothetical protein [Actinomycetota bacterium]